MRLRTFLTVVAIVTFLPAPRADAATFQVAGRWQWTARDLTSPDSTASAAASAERDGDLRVSARSTNASPVPVAGPSAGVDVDFSWLWLDVRHSGGWGAGTAGATGIGHVGNTYAVAPGTYEVSATFTDLTASVTGNETGSGGVYARLVADSRCRSFPDCSRVLSGRAVEIRGIACHGEECSAPDPLVLTTTFTVRENESLVVTAELLAAATAWSHGELSTSGSATVSGIFLRKAA